MSSNNLERDPMELHEVYFMSENEITEIEIEEPEKSEKSEEE